MSTLAKILLVLLILLVAVLVATRRGKQIVRKIFLGGAPPGPGAARHELGDGLHRLVAAQTGPPVAVHALSEPNYSGRIEGGAAVEGGARKTRPWTAHESWDSLRGDPAALRAYMADRARALVEPNFDWGGVMAEIGPRLGENREYIGLINLGSDGRTLRIEEVHASPDTADPANPLYFASVPGRLVEKVARRPALFIFHTHPADPRASPMPSSHDLATAIRLAARGSFAASVVISRYGVIVHGLEWEAYKEIHAARSWRTALDNYIHDVIASHEAVRSWGSFTMGEFFELYRRFRLSLFVFPSSELVAGTYKKMQHSLESQIDLELLRDQMGRHSSRRSKNVRSRGRHAALIGYD